MVFANCQAGPYLELVVDAGVKGTRVPLKYKSAIHCLTRSKRDGSVLRVEMTPYTVPHHPRWTYIPGHFFFPTTPAQPRAPYYTRTTHCHLRRSNCQQTSSKDKSI